MANFVTKVPPFGGLLTKSGAVLFNMEPKIIDVTTIQLALSAMYDRAKVRSLIVERNRCNIKDNINNLRDAIDWCKRNNIATTISCVDSPHNSQYHEQCWQAIGWNKIQAKQRRRYLRHVSHQLKFSNNNDFLAFLLTWRDTRW
ncbi:hypothetical protein [Methylobacterium sp. CM6247]